jgi:hypothetical protein
MCPRCACLRAGSGWVLAGLAGNWQLSANFFVCRSKKKGSEALRSFDFPLRSSQTASGAGFHLASIAPAERAHSPYRCQEENWLIDLRNGYL